MEITKREVAFSVVIVCFLLILGVILSGRINDRLMNQFETYNTALQIDNNSDLFQYGMRTDIGNAFVYGSITVIDPVSYDGVNGQYGTMTKVTEKYTKHKRTVTKTKMVNGKEKTYTDTEEYWTWDTISTEHQQATKISFLDVIFPFETIDCFSEEYLTTKKLSHSLREKYYGSKTSYVGTVFADLRDDTISETSFYNELSIDETIERLESKWQLIVFWIFWIVLIVGCVYGFYYIDNNWLE